MTAAGTGAVFFLGTRAHYQVLQQPESRFDLENGNASTESIYQKPAPAVDSSGNHIIGERNLAYCDSVDNVTEEKEVNNIIKRRSKRRQSETALCERDVEMKPALLNHLGQSETSKKPSRRRINILTLLASLGRRKPRLHKDSVQYLQQLESALTACSYRESCRCLECQSSYFDCDESEDYCSESSEYELEYDFPTQYVVQTQSPAMEDEDEDDEVFVDPVPTDTTSTDLLLEPSRKLSDTSEESDTENDLQLEVAAGAPVLTDYLLTHPVTCAIQ